MTVVRDETIRHMQFNCDGERCGMSTAIEVRDGEGGVLHALHNVGWAGTIEGNHVRHYCPGHGPSRPEPGGGLFSRLGEREEHGGLFS